MAAELSHFSTLPVVQGLDQVNSLTVDGIVAKIKGLFGAA
jgi:hypothetical protein